MRHNELPGEYTDGETPVPIPNTEAKLVRPMVVRKGESRYREDYEPCTVTGAGLAFFRYRQPPAVLHSAAGLDFATLRKMRRRGLPLQHFPKREIRREGRLRGLRFAMKKVSEKQGIVETRAFRFFTTEVTKKHEVLESQITQIPRILVGLEVFSTNLAF